MEPTDYIFYNLFLKLKNELKIELDFSQYEAFLYLFTTGDWKTNLTQSDVLSAKEKEAEIYRVLSNLCQSIWVPRQKFVPRFLELFDDAFDELKLLLPVIDGVIKEEESGVIEEVATEATDEPNIEGTKPDESPSNEEEEEEETELEKEKEEIQVNEQKEVETVKDFFINFEDGKAEEINPKEIKKEIGSVFKTPFIFSDEKHFPVRSRQVVQLLHKLKNYNKRTPGPNIDVRRTIRKLAKEKVLESPVYEMIKKGQQHIILIIEQEGPMIPFKSWALQLANDIRQSSNEIRLEIFYFSNYPLPIREESIPDFYLFTSANHLTFRRLSDVLKSIDKQTDILFFSDAGALDEELNSDRVQYTLKVLEQLKEYTKGVLWLNPLPEEKWTDTSAAFISLFVSMVPYTYEGIEKGLKEILE